MAAVRRIVTMLLLAVFGLSWTAPLLALATPSEAHLPACCRRSGVHHCAMGTASSAAAGSGARLTAHCDRCPYGPASLPSVHLQPTAMPGESAEGTPPASHPHGIAQTESLRRMARERSRHKRGPPAAALSRA